MRTARNLHIGMGSHAVLEGSKKVGSLDTSGVHAASAPSVAHVVGIPRSWTARDAQLLAPSFGCGGIAPGSVAFHQSTKEV